MARLAAGESVRTVAAALDVSAASVVRWSQRLRATGSAALAASAATDSQKILGSHRDWLIERAQAAAFTLRGLTGELSERGLQVDYRTVWEFVHPKRLSFKNVWAAPSASDSLRFALVSFRQSIRSRTMSWPRWRSARPGPHPSVGVERHSLNRISGTPINCQAIPHLPTADLINRSCRVSAAG